MSLPKSTEYGAYHLADNPAAYQPVRENNFRVIFPGLNRLLRAGTADDYITNGEEVIDFSVVSFTAPHFSQDSIDVSRGNSTIHFAGKPKFDAVSLVINDFAGADGKSVLESWQALSYDVFNDTISSAANYKLDGLVFEYLPDNTLIKVWEIKGCFITSLKETDWNNEGSNKKTVTASISVDRAYARKPDEIV